MCDSVRRRSPSWFYIIIEPHVAAHVSPGDRPEAVAGIHVRTGLWPLVCDSLILRHQSVSELTFACKITVADVRSEEEILLLENICGLDVSQLTHQLPLPASQPRDFLAQFGALPV